MSNETTKEVKVIEDYTKLTRFDATHAEIAIIKSIIAPDHTEREFLYFMDICAKINLDPRLNEVWTWKSKKTNKITTFVGRDGLRTNAERHPDFKGLFDSKPIYENDTYIVNYSTGELIHKVESFKNRGELIGAWAYVVRGDKKYFEDVYLSDYKPDDADLKDGDAWKTNPVKMICKCAEANALKKAFPISGVVIDTDVKIKDGELVAVNSKSAAFDEANIDQSEEAFYNSKLDELLAVWDKFRGKDKAYFKQMIQTQKEKGQLTLEKIEEWKRNLSNDTEDDAEPVKEMPKAPSSEPKP